jgi:hypothetical protein
VYLGHAEHQRWLRKALVESEPGPIAQVRAIVRAHVKLHAEYAMLCVVANNELHALSPEASAASLAVRQQSIELMVDVIHRGVEQGVFHVTHEWVTLAAVSGMGMRVANWYRPDFELTPDQIADIHMELATRMLVGPTAAP